MFINLSIPTCVSLDVLSILRPVSVVNLLTSNVVDHVFDHWSDQMKNHKFGICCFSAEHAALWSKKKD